jgi:outer membrane biosynthesis protein TonB
VAKKKTAKATKPKTAKKPAKPKAAKKPKTAAKPKTVAKKKKPASAKAPKPKAAPKPKPKTVKKPKPKTAKKPKAVFAVAALAPQNAVPQITSPSANASVPSGQILTIDVDTNRGDLGYIVRWTDITTPGAPVDHPVAAPAGASFSANVAASDISAGLTYRIFVFVDPSSGATPPHNTDTIDVTT